ncbi:hypothetical protein [Dechloromonas sp. A34]|uniref:hypothetical protein n=1 Tax=Dechloromonas sp. A34 TaxID=447588 RepID=UPI0022496290|nr:hypothetical protein [Dechloromonas sp. A34]
MPRSTAGKPYRPARKSCRQLPPLVVAAMLGAALIGCQRQETPLPKSDIVLPLIEGEQRFGVPLGPGASQELPPRPRPGETIDSQHPTLRRPGLIAI